MNPKNFGPNIKSTFLGSGVKTTVVWVSGNNKFFSRPNDLVVHSFCMITELFVKTLYCRTADVSTYCYITVLIYRFLWCSVRVVPDLIISNPSGFEENLFSDHGTIRVMKLMASTMLSAAIMSQYISVFPFLFASFSQNLWDGSGFSIIIYRLSNTN